MAANNHNCTITSLTNSGRFKSYGSVRNSPVTSGTLEHHIQPTDTIEGLAIKYSVTVEEILKTNRLWNRFSLFSKSIIKIPINDFNFHLYDSESTEEETDAREEDVLTECPVVQPRSPEQPTSEISKGIKQISSLLEGADDELAKALKFQAKLASRCRVTKPSDGYNREPVEVTYRAQDHSPGSSRTPVKTSLTTESQKKQLEAAEDEMFEL